MTKNFRFLTCEEVINLPSLIWVIDNVIPERGFAVLYGPPGTGKSFLVLDMVSKVALGKPWLGVETTKGECIYLCSEGQGSLKYRVEALVKNIDSIPTKVFFGLESFHLVHEVSDFIGAIMEQKISPVLIVIDTLSRSIVNCDENSSKDMGVVIDAIGRISRETGAAVLVVHHTGKNESRGPRGSNSINGAADAFIAIKKLGNRISVSFEKLKDSGAIQPKVCTLEKVPLEENSSCFVKYHGNFKPAGKKHSASVSQDKIIDVLRQNPQGLTFSQWEQKCLEKGIKKTPFCRALVSLKNAKDKRLTQNEETRVYRAPFQLINGNEQIGSMPL